MLLCIDCGNTNTVFSIWDGEAFIATWRTRSRFWFAINVTITI